MEYETSVMNKTCDPVSIRVAVDILPSQSWLNQILSHVSAICVPMSQSRPPPRPRAPTAQRSKPVITVPAEEKPEATEPVLKDPSHDSLTEEEPASTEPLTEAEAAKVRDEDRVGPGPRFRQTPIRASRGHHIV